MSNKVIGKIGDGNTDNCEVSREVSLLYEIWERGGKRKYLNTLVGQESEADLPFIQPQPSDLSDRCEA